jgi:hypothetical protein
MRQGKRIPRGDGPSLPVVPVAVARWATKVTAMATRLGPHDARAESRQRALADVQGLLSPIARQTGWQLAEQAGERQPDTFQYLLHKRLGTADAVRDDLRRYVRAPLGAPQAVQIVDATGFLKSGPKSAGVARPSAGPAGKIDHGQSGVFLAYASLTGRTRLDRERLCLKSQKMSSKLTVLDVKKSVKRVQNRFLRQSRSGAVSAAGMVGGAGALSRGRDVCHGHMPDHTAVGPSAAGAGGGCARHVGHRLRGVWP